MKALIEKRNALIEEMETLLGAAETETRAMNEEENTRFASIQSEIAELDKTIKAKDEVRAMEKKEVKENKEQVEQRALDEKNFAEYIRGEKRALDAGSNGGVIPTTIANRIIDRVKELSPILQLADVYTVKGNLVFPVVDIADGTISAAYSSEFTELTESTTGFKTVELGGFLSGVLTKVSNSLVNNVDFDVVSWVIGKVAQAVAEFLEKELINGTTNKMSGINSTTNVVTTSTVGAIVADDLIDVQMSVPEIYQASSSWIMNKSTFKAIRKLKDDNKNYILNKDATMAFGWELLGKPVYITESAEVVATGNDAVFYGDYKGLAVKIVPASSQIQVLTEKYATQNAIGVVGWVEADSKVVDNQRIAKLTIQ